MVQFFLPIAALLAGSFLTIVWLALPVAGRDVRFDSMLIDQQGHRSPASPAVGRAHAPREAGK